MPMPVVPVQKSNIGGIGMIATRAIQPELREVFKMALCACNPPVVIRQIVALSNPHILADPGGATDGDRQCTKNAKLSSAGSWAWSTHKPMILFGLTPALKSFATSSDSWRPALTSKATPWEDTPSYGCPSVIEWLFVELHWLHKIPWIFIIKIEIVVPNFGFASRFLKGTGCIICTCHDTCEPKNHEPTTTQHVVYVAIRASWKLEGWPDLNQTDCHTGNSVSSLGP